MELITLQFQTIRDLWNFKFLVAPPETKLNLHELTLTHNYSQVEIEVALSKFGATIINAPLEEIFQVTDQD